MKQASQVTVVQAISLLKQGSSAREEESSTGLSGRRKILSMVDERYCVRQVTKTRRSSAAKVAKELEKDIGRKVIAVTVRRTLRKAGLGAIEKPKTALLSAKNICKRLSWCMAHKDWTIDDWKRVVWSEETKINRFNSDGRTWTWIRSGESLKSHHVKMTVKHGGGNKVLYKEISEDELERTTEFNIDKLELERQQVIF
ncbi:hypothetical protein G6F46_012567 [Rhizopus delemar]|nr:hypothetical protein G6F49_013027 [Rhizopus delemar]KAG1607065.1 hypothetical protein G6F46_012567 [Rhizopus delemar]